MFADEKSYDVPQRSGYTTSFILLDLASDAWFKVDETSKTEHGQSFLRIVVENGIHLLDYPCTLYTDGCGSMRIASKDSKLPISSQAKGIRRPARACVEIM